MLRAMASNGSTRYVYFSALSGNGGCISWAVSTKLLYVFNELLDLGLGKFAGQKAIEIPRRSLDKKAKASCRTYLIVRLQNTWKAIATAYHTMCPISV